TSDTCDGIAPAAISDLTVQDYGKKFVDLSWTAPGDDANYGTAKQFDVRYSLTAITESNWGTRTPATGIPVPGPNGTLHSCVTVTGLDSCTYYYFGIKTRDDRPQWSSLSNIPIVRTLCSGSNPVCNGGGMFAQGGGGGGWAPENTVLSGSSGSGVTDVYRLKG